MRTAKTSITLQINHRTEVKKGVWENQLVAQTVRADKQNIFQQRVDQALADGQPITARFKIRDVYDLDSLDYVDWQGHRFKVRSINPDAIGHFVILEIGEQI